jgi:thiol-disulfide isomerase/thioredoxin
MLVQNKAKSFITLVSNHLLVLLQLSSVRILLGFNLRLSTFHLSFIRSRPSPFHSSFFSLSSRLACTIGLWILVSVDCRAQYSILIKGKFINNTKYAKVLMKKFAVGNFPIAAASIRQDSFALSIPADIEPGVYRFQYAMAEGEQYLDIIINGKEKLIAFNLKANEASVLPDFVHSEENKLWYAYIAQNNQQLARIQLLHQFINAYPHAKAKVLIAAQKEWSEEQALYWKKYNSFKKEMQGTWAYHMVINRPYYFADPHQDPRLQDFEKKEHYWDGFDASNPKLINTPLYSEHILNYLRYWMNPNLDFSAEEKINGFKRSVDVVIRKFATNEETHDFAYKYLSLGFKEIGEEEVLQYLDEQYKQLANRCFDDLEKTEFEKRMTSYIALQKGKAAANFTLNGKNFTEKDLYSIKDDQVLLVFWSNSCPHCMEEIPKINEWVATQKGIKILALSLNHDPSSDSTNVRDYPHLLHSCDYKSWDSEAAQSYFIAATPTYILLDKEKKIEAKFSSFEQFKKTR